MAGLIGALSNAAQSLMTQSEGVQLAGKNLANSNTAGYAKQRLIIGSLGTVQTQIGAQNMGTQAVGIQQIRDKYLDAQVTRETSQTSYLQAQETNLLKAQSNLDEQVDRTSSTTSITDTSASTTGISAALNAYFNAFESVAANPGDAGAKQVLLQKADLLSNKINVTDARLASLQEDITAQNVDDLTTVNNLLQQVASLNGQIQKVELNAPNSAVDLRDERQAKLEELAKYMDFTTKEIPDSHGQIQILANGDNDTKVTLIDKTQAQTLSYDPATKSFSGNAPDSHLVLQSGSLQGNIDVRDGAIQQLRDGIHTLTQQLVTSVNQAYSAAGAGDFFKLDDDTGIVTVNSTITYSNLKTGSDGNAGSNDIALAVADIANRKFSTTGSNAATGVVGGVIDGTLSGYYSKVASGFGQAISGVESKLADQQTVQTLVNTQRDSVSGISMDEELTDLMKYQRGFQASSKLINVIDNLLDVVVNGLIR